MALDGKVWGHQWPPTYLLFPPIIGPMGNTSNPNMHIPPFPHNCPGSCTLFVWSSLFIIIAFRTFISLISIYIFGFLSFCFVFILHKDNSWINENILATPKNYIYAPFPHIFLSFWESNSKPYVWEAILCHWFYYSTTVVSSAQPSPSCFPLLY